MNFLNRKFLLVGNGSYQNRGCEAIVRGTMAILRREFGSDIRADAGVYADARELLQQNTLESDPAVSSFGLKQGGRRWSTTWWAMQVNRRLGTSLAAQHGPLERYIKQGGIALEVGGDNYSLDYGIPETFLSMDRYLQSRGVRMVLWGASVGPFDAEPGFAPRMFDHLRTFAGIFVRESESLEYLKRNGVEANVHLVADPAFAMEPAEPDLQKLGFTIPEGAVALNFSPLLTRYFVRSPRQAWEMTPSEIVQWRDFCTELVTATARKTDRPILLVPHVGAPNMTNDDYSFLKAVRAAAAEAVTQPILCLPGGLSAAETKWVLARCAVFAGARTHATIAALASGVPTLSIGYSLKARGINRDIFGHLDYCVSATELTVQDFVVRLMAMLAQQRPIREALLGRIPQITEASFRAGSLLRKIAEA